MAISLTPLFKKQLKTISRAVIPNFSRVKINSNGVILSRGLFKRKHRIPLHDFLTETLPKEINRWAESKDIKSPLPYFGNSVEFLLHMSAIGETNIISYLWKSYVYVITLEQNENGPILRVKSRSIVSTRVTTNVVENKVLRSLKRMRKNVKRTFIMPVSNYATLDVVYRSPDIRGSPKIRSYLAVAG